MEFILETNDSELRIKGSGLEFLKLKSEIAKRSIEYKIVSKDTLTIATTSILALEDVIDHLKIEKTPVTHLLDQYSLHGRTRELALSNLSESNFTNVSDEWQETLDPAQAAAVSAMTTPGILGLCLFDEQGSGKTVMTIGAFDNLKQNGLIDKMVVVCPKSMVSEWPKDIINFTGKRYKTLLAEGNKQKKYEIVLSDFDILVTNYEGIDVMLTSLLALSKNHRFLLVVDESYYLKNGESLRSDNVGRFRNGCTKCFVLCGTPAPNSAHDLINQFNLADRGYTFAGFRKSKQAIDDWEKIANLIETRGLFIRRLKTSILENVPDKNFHVIKVQLQGRQKAMYDQAREELELELRSLDNATFRKSLRTYFQRRSVLLQICACPSAIDPILDETGAKYLDLDLLVEELILKKRKVIIWSFYKKSLDEIANRYSRYDPVRVDGSISTDKRRGAVESFQNDPSIMLFLGNPAAAGAGITLHASYDAIYVSYSNQAAHYLQSLDRIHRRGQVSNNVNYYFLVCKGTIEETEITTLRQKEMRQHDLLGDHVQWPTSLDDALRELQENV